MHWNAKNNGKSIPLAVEASGAVARGWFSVAFSFSGLMAPSDAVVGNPGNAVSTYHVASYSSVAPARGINLGGKSCATSGGKTVMKFTRSVGDGGAVPVRVKGVNKIIWGYSNDGSKSVAYHGANIPRRILAAYPLPRCVPASPLRTRFPVAYPLPRCVPASPLRTRFPVAYPLPRCVPASPLRTRFPVAYPLPRCVPASPLRTRFPVAYPLPRCVPASPLRTRFPVAYPLPRCVPASPLRTRFPVAYPLPRCVPASPLRTRFPVAYPLPRCVPASPLRTRFPVAYPLPRCVPASPLRTRFPVAYPLPRCVPASPLRTRFPVAYPLPRCVPASPFRTRFPVEYPLPRCVPASPLRIRIPVAYSHPRCIPAFPEPLLAISIFFRRMNALTTTNKAAVTTVDTTIALLKVPFRNPFRHVDRFSSPPFLLRPRLSPRLLTLSLRNPFPPPHPLRSPISGSTQVDFSCDGSSPGKPSPSPPVTKPPPVPVVPPSKRSKLCPWSSLPGFTYMLQLKPLRQFTLPVHVPAVFRAPSHQTFLSLPPLPVASCDPPSIFRLFVHWRQVNPNLIEIAMEAKPGSGANNGWLALAWTSNGRMAPADAIIGNRMGGTLGTYLITGYTMQSLKPAAIPLGAYPTVFKRGTGSTVMMFRRGATGGTIPVKPSGLNNLIWAHSPSNSKTLAYHSGSVNRVWSYCVPKPTCVPLLFLCSGRATIDFSCKVAPVASGAGDDDGGSGD
ncbi:unnamed protein product [Closterium sp. Yama58-4]|nr:unnamed protein product [Closterium sp. Yama58-4]